MSSEIGIYLCVLRKSSLSKSWTCLSLKAYIGLSGYPMLLFYFLSYAFKCKFYFFLQMFAFQRMPYTWGAIKGILKHFTLWRLSPCYIKLSYCAVHNLSASDGGENFEHSCILWVAFDDISKLAEAKLRLCFAHVWKIEDV